MTGEAPAAEAGTEVRAAEEPSMALAASISTAAPEMSAAYRCSALAGSSPPARNAFAAVELASDRFW